MNQINSARRQREAAVEKAEAEKILAAVRAAEAEAEAKYLSGMGMAKMMTAIMRGFETKPCFPGCLLLFVSSPSSCASVFTSSICPTVYVHACACVHVRRCVGCSACGE